MCLDVTGAYNIKPAFPGVESHLVDVHQLAVTVVHVVAHDGVESAAAQLVAGRGEDGIPARLQEAAVHPERLMLVFVREMLNQPDAYHDIKLLAVSQVADVLNHKVDLVTTLPHHLALTTG